MASRGCHCIACSSLHCPAFSGSLQLRNVSLCEKLSISRLQGTAQMWSPEVAGIRETVRRRYAGRDDWEKEFLLGSGSDVQDDERFVLKHAYKCSPNADWATRARDRALQALLARDPNFKGLSSSWSKTRRNSRVRKENVGRLPEKPHVGNICWPEEKAAEKSVSHGHSNQRDDERRLNRQLIDAADCQQILVIVSKILETDGLQLLTPLNAATALHRIARHMERVSMPRSERLAFARQREMLQLVSLAVSLLRGCTAQGVSNIAWALSKVGGNHLYEDEMDVVGHAALDIVAKLQPQHLANLAGAYASMRLANPLLFQSLARQASLVANQLQPQELTQLLWAFSSLFHSASPLFDALDEICGGPVAPKSEMAERHVGIKSPAAKQESDIYNDCNLEHLAVIAWSYSVLHELHRPSFASLWGRLCQACRTSEPSRSGFSNSRFLSQLHQVKLTIDLEYPGLHLPLGSYLEDEALAAWNKQKKQLLLTSTLQREIQQLVVGTGLQFVPEYTAAHYSVDLALVERKIAVEVDGPSHFTRNTGTPLGNTILKARHLKAAGWKVVSVPYHELEKLQGVKNHVTFIRELLQGCL